MSSLVSFAPYDTLWFREGRPFEQMDEGLAEARSIFPPSPSTLAGTIAAALHPLGNTGTSADISQELRFFSLGDATAIDQIHFTGPFLTTTGRNLYVPAPATMAVQKAHRGKDVSRHRESLVQAEKRGLYWPSQESRKDDDRWLPRLFTTMENDQNDYENFATLNAWVSVEDFFRHCHVARSSLRAPLDNAPVYSDRYVAEQRIGITIEPGLRSVAEGKLYAAQHLRLMEFTGQLPLQLCMLMDTPSHVNTDQLDGRIAALGGKGRPSLLAVENFDLAAMLPSTEVALREAAGRLHFRLTAMTPVPADNSEWGLSALTDCLECAKEDIAVHTALMPTRAAHIGVWNRFANDGHVRKIIRCHRPGTVWFVSVAARAVTPDKRKHLARAILDHRFVPDELASLRAMGFGLLALGDWPETFEKP